MSTEKQNTKAPRTKVGHVVSNKMEKTVVVQITTKKADPNYKKFVKHSRKFLAHDEDNKCRVGDVVRIASTRPMSKNKNWVINEVISEGKE